MKGIHTYIYLLSLLYLSHTHTEAPQLTIVMVIDQLACRNLEKVGPYLKGGLRFLLDEGLRYTQAHTPYASPSTGPGHATLNTGVLPKTHGIINNTWGDNDNQNNCDDGRKEEDAVFGPNGMQPYGKSARYIMVDGLSDQLILQTQQHKNYTVCALSLKSHSAICAANKMGKAIWFDPQTGMMTSSKAYFNELPTWLQTFNQKKRPGHKPYTWHLYHKCLPAAYKFKHTHNYKGTYLSQSVIGKTFHPNRSAQEPFKEFMMTPAANQLIFDAALACLDAYFCKDNPDEKLFLWVLPSGLDLAGHLCGPNSIEYLDILYHLDRQIKKFIDCVNAKTRKRNILWALVSDHGIAPVPEQIQEDGYHAAYRIMSADIVKQLNEKVQAEFDLTPVISSFNGSGIYLNKALLNTVDKKKCKKIKHTIISYLEAQRGIKKVWTFKQLATSCLEPGTIESFYQNQLFKGRSGDLIVQVYPYCMISEHTHGACHNSPYNYDTHIPIIIYQRACYQRKIINDKVYNTQFAPTLAHILEIPRPSACTADVLPGVIVKEDCCF